MTRTIRCVAALLGLSLTAHWKAYADAKSPTESHPPQLHTMVSDDTCRDEVNKPMTLRRNDQVEIIRTVKPSDPRTLRLPPHDPISMKVNLTYVRAATGSHAGEYCWVASVHVR